MKYSKPDFDEEWMEALRYPEFEEMGYEGWLDVAKNNFEITNYKKIKDVLNNTNLDFDSLEKDKKERFEKSFENGVVEIPMVVKFSDSDYDLLGGNTRLAGLIKNGINPKLWVVDLSKYDYEMNESEKLKGGLSDGKTIEDVAKKHKIDVDLLKVQLKIGVKVEKKDHTDDKKTAEEIALDHLSEDPTYYIKLKKVETKEMDAGSSGAFEGPIFAITKKKLQEEILSTGEFDVPAFGKTTKGRKSPLKIGGTDTIYKNRAVKDKKWPRFGGPKAVYVKVKDKCKKFPYCNQGIGALEFIHEDKELMNAIKETAENYGIPYSEMEKIVLNEINKIFI
jgi:hypothetical protein